MSLVLITFAITEDENAIVFQVYDPKLRNSKPCVYRKLQFGVLLQRLVCNFHGEEDFVRAGVMRGVKIGASFADRQIRLRLVEIIQADWILNRDGRFISEQARKEVSCTVDTAAMANSDRAHRNNLTFDELHSIIRIENSNLSHAVVFVNGEMFPLDLNNHVAVLHGNNFNTRRMMHTSFHVAAH